MRQLRQLRQQRQQQPASQPAPQPAPQLPPIRIVSIDPGETSAFVVGEILEFPASSPHAKQFNQDDTDTPYGKWHMAAWGQWRGVPELVEVVSQLFQTRTHVVVEDYRVYPHKTRQHIGSPVYTAREIGRIEWLAYVQHCTISFQTASQAKQQWGNQRLRKHYPNLYKRTGGKAHIRDALRHLLTFMEDNQLHVFFRPSDAI